MSDSNRNLAQILQDKKTWWVHFLIVAAICVSGLLYLGQQTYSGAPPLESFVTADGQTVFSREQIKQGQEVFHLRGLMGYGSFWGDGAERGPDFTADSLHRTVLSMRAFYEEELGANQSELSLYDKDAVAARVRREVHNNTWDEQAGQIVINDAQVRAYNDLVKHYTAMFNDPDYAEAFEPTGFISDPEELRSLTAFFYWGGWVSAANRPGQVYSYTHNWPYDPDAGNTATSQTWIWSFISIFGLFLGILAVLYIYGQFKEQGDPFVGNGTSLTTNDLEEGRVRATQRATYKYFIFSIVLFGCQVVAGIFASMDFVRPFGFSLGEIIPFSVLRSYHTLFRSTGSSWPGSDTPSSSCPESPVSRPGR